MGTYKKVNIDKQRKIDLEISINIEKEAKRLYEEYLNSSIITIGDKSFRNYFPLVNPMNILTGGYLIYDEDTAFYSSKNPIKICLERFQELKRDGNI